MPDRNAWPTGMIGRRDILGVAVAAPTLFATGQVALAQSKVRPMSTPIGNLSPGARDFDFLHGRWTVLHRKLRQRLRNNVDWFDFPGTLEVKPILHGLGNIDDNDLQDPGGRYSASTLRIFSPETEQWTIRWIDSRSPGIDAGAVVGRFRGSKGIFFTNDEFDGRPIGVRTTYENVGDGKAQWTQAFSREPIRRSAANWTQPSEKEGGQTFSWTEPETTQKWEVNWIMDFTRTGDPR